MTNAEKLKEIFGKDFSIVSHAIKTPDGQEFKTYSILTNELDQMRVERWLDSEFKE